MDLQVEEKRKDFVEYAQYVSKEIIFHFQKWLVEQTVMLNVMKIDMVQ